MASYSWRQPISNIVTQSCFRRPKTAEASTVPMLYRTGHRAILFTASALLVCCASLSGGRERYAVCDYDQAWEAALATVKDRSVTQQDKEQGHIETDWLEIPMPGRTYGALKREVQDSRDRSRLILTVKRLDDVTRITYVEERQEWAFRGGSRLFGWAPTSPSDQVMRDIQNRLDKKLEEHGCVST